MFDTNLVSTQAPSPATSTWTDAVIDLDDDDLTELIDDALVEARAASGKHALVASLLCHFLSAWACPRRAGVVVASAHDDAHDATGHGLPDLQFFGNEAFPTALRAPHDEARPDLVVAVVDDGTVARDRVTRLHDYAALGVPEYWLVDPAHRTLERLILWRDQYTIVEALSDDQVFRPATFDGLEIPLEDLWAL